MDRLIDLIGLKKMQELFSYFFPFYKGYKITFEHLEVNENKRIEAQCCGISFKNIGTVDAHIDAFPLPAGDPMITYPTDVPHLDMTTYRIRFDNAVGTKKILVIKRHYTCR